MAKTASIPGAAPVALGDATAMADYARSEGGLAALDRGISDIKEGRVLIGRGSLSVELTRRASTRRNGR